MKKLFIAFVLALFVMNVVAASEYPILDNQVEIRKNHIKWMSAIKKVGMDATIEYFDGINGSDTTTLSEIKEDFEEQENTVLATDTHVGLNNAMRDLRAITGEFRKEVRNQLKETKGRPLVLAAEIITALDEHKDELESYKDAYWEIKEENALENFDLRVERAEWVLSKLEEQEYNTTEAQAKLDEIKDKKTELGDAFESRDNKKIVLVQLEILALSKELGQIVKDLQVEVPSRIRARYWLHVGNRVLERTSMIIEDLDELGIDVNSLEELHDEAEELLEEASDAFENDDYEGAIEKLKEFKEKLKEMKEAYKQIISEEVPEDFEQLIKSTEEAIDETTNQMEEDLE